MEKKGGNNLKRNFTDTDLKKYPGGTIILAGLKDIRKNKLTTIEALALFTSSPRLNGFGFKIDENIYQYPHLLLYEELKKKYFTEAYNQYNSLMRRISKFCNHFEQKYY